MRRKDLLVVVAVFAVAALGVWAGLHRQSRSGGANVQPASQGSDDPGHDDVRRGSGRREALEPVTEPVVSARTSNSPAAGSSSGTGAVAPAQPRDRRARRATYKLHLRVVDASNQPYRDQVSFTVVPAALDHGLAETPPLAQTATPDAYGWLALTKLAQPGLYHVTVWNDSVASGPVGVNVIGGVAVKEPLTIASVQVFAVASLRVLVLDDNTGLPVESAATVTVAPFGDAGISNMRAVGAKTANGVATLQQVPTGRCAVWVEAAGYTGLAVGKVRKQFSTKVVVELGSAEMAAGLTVRMLRGLEVTGTVVDPAGAAIRARVVAVDRMGRTKSTDSDSAGHFAFRDLTVGPYSFVAHHEAWGYGEGALNLAATDARSSVELKLRWPAKLTGTVCDEQRKPVVGAQVRIMPARAGVDVALETSLLDPFAARRQLVVTDADGRFSVTWAAEQVHLLVGNNLPSQPAVVRDLQLSANKATHVDVVLESGASIRGRLVDGGGTAVFAAILRISPRRPGQPVEYRPGPGGRFVISGLSDVDRPYRIESWSTVGALYGSRSGVHVGDDDVVITMLALQRLHVRLDTAGRAMPESVQVALTIKPSGQQGWSERSEHTVASDATVFLNRVHPATVAVSVRAEGYVREDVDVRAILRAPTSAGGDPSITIVLQPEGVVMGSVVGAEGQGVAGAWVLARLDDRLARQPGSPWYDVSAISNERGAFDLTGLGPGVYRVYARIGPPGREPTETELDRCQAVVVADGAVVRDLMLRVP